jgi:hypothetical protein
MGEAFATLGRLTGLPFLIGVRPFATLFTFAALLALGWITDPFFLQEPFAFFANPIVVGTLFALFAIEFLSDKYWVVGHAWDLVNTAIKPLASTFLVFVLMNAVDAGQRLGIIAIAIAVVGGAAVPLSTHLASAGARMRATRATRGLGNFALSGAADLVSVAGVAIVVTHPVVVGIAVVVFLVVFAFLAPKLVRGIAKLVSAPFRLVAYWLGLGKEESDRHQGPSP